MGKLILIAGPNDSGKSRFAEALIARGQAARVYIATMVPATEENFARIEKHRVQRAGLGFRTLELPGSLQSAEVPPGADVLLEDVSNLLANALFQPDGNRDGVEAEILGLAARCGRLFAVTISGLDPAAYTGETAAYIRELNRLNESLRRAASAAFELRGGVPRLVKGADHDTLESLALRDFHVQCDSCAPG